MHWTQTPILAQMAGLLIVGVGCLGTLIWQQLTGEIWVRGSFQLRRRRARREDSPRSFWLSQALTAGVVVISFGLLAFLISEVISGKA